MKWYADEAARRWRQAGFDLFVVVWIAVWVGLGVRTHHQIAASASGARKIERGGQQMSTHLHDAASVLSRTPIVGAKVRKPVDQAADAGSQLEHAGGQIANNLGRVGAAIGFEIALVPVLVGVLGWVVLRVGYARRAGRALALLALPEGNDLLALDALRSLRVSTLAHLGTDPVAGWRSGDPDVSAALAGAYLSSLGLASAGTSPPRADQDSRASTGVLPPREDHEIEAD